MYCKSSGDCSQVKSRFVDGEGKRAAVHADAVDVGGDATWKVAQGIGRLSQKSVWVRSC